MATYDITSMIERYAGELTDCINRARRGRWIQTMKRRKGTRRRSAHFDEAGRGDRAIDAFFFPTQEQQVQSVVDHFYKCASKAFGVSVEALQGGPRP